MSDNPQDYAAVYERIAANPKFDYLVRHRGRLAWSLSAVIVFAYYGYILVIAFKPALLARPIFTGGVVTWGIPAGIGLILLSIILTGVYAYIANVRYEGLTREIIEEAKP